ncbi:DNA polymerase V [Cedecea neteri]|uniref:DNA polymerase V n=1 Tax=Cedecea neteri TaxID=158822 RepID=UPI0028933004|nr:DNA polymerase V [Cedecea neteri]WNJ77809.1 DNA polymerase V [Cedecea neteri]
MPRYDDIRMAFINAIRIAANGKRTVTTEDFVKELDKLNWKWDLKQANEWIESSVSTFRDVSTQEGEERTFMLFNPNGGL